MARDVRLTTLEREVLKVFRAINEGDSLQDALRRHNHDPNGAVGDYIIMRMREVCPWIDDRLSRE